eukprot:2147467-Pleurochrysis_carterae.AAC.1
MERWGQLVNGLRTAGRSRQMAAPIIWKYRGMGARVVVRQLMVSPGTWRGPAILAGCCGSEGSSSAQLARRLGEPKGRALPARGFTDPIIK